MKASTKINKLQGLNLNTVIDKLKTDFSVLKTESPDRNINHIYLSDDELNSVTLYSSCGVVKKISYNYNFVN